MNTRSGILAGGNWIIDHVKIIDTWPAQDTLVNILSSTHGTGGSPYNILIDLAKLGARFPLSAVGLVGEDGDGQIILDDCAHYKIDASAMQATDKAPTSYTDVMTVQATGRRTFFHARGANALLDSSHFDFSKTMARLFHLGYLLLLDIVDSAHPEFGTVAAEILSRAQAAGMKTSIDVVSEDSDRFARVVLPTLKYVDLCIMNEFEAGRVTGHHIRTESGLDRKALRAAMEQLLAAGVREHVIVHFPEGGVALGRDGQMHEHPSVKLPEAYIKGAAGAGDAFTSGVLLGWHEQLPINDWLRYGVCAAAANLADETCTGGMLSLDKVLEIGARYGFRE
jgi:sugar/nucleoside kinase (ribokinase family)